MKIVFLNTWSGRIGQPFFDFIKKESKDADVFCLQEVSVSLNLKLDKLLKDFKGFFEIGGSLPDVGESCGQVTFLRKSIENIKSKKILLHEIEAVDIGFLLLTQFKINDTLINLGNVHGKSKPGNKLDSDIRLNQSRIILDTFKDLEGIKIIGGDFNLLPNTKSIEMFEKDGFVNLIKKYKIKTTRNSYAWERFKNRKDYVKQNFADYVFVSRDIKIKSFEVPQVMISDHNPMILEFDLL